MLIFRSSFVWNLYYSQNCDKGVKPLRFPQLQKAYWSCWQSVEMLKHPGHLRVHLKHKFPSFEGSSQMPTHWSDPHISSAYISGKGNQGGSVAISTEWNWLKQHNKKKKYNWNVQQYTRIRDKQSQLLYFWVPLSFQPVKMKILPFLRS